MRVSRGKASVSGDITVSEDLDFLTTWKVLRLSAPASGGALRKGNRDIGTAEISLTANILATQIANTALTRALMTAQGDMITRNGTAPKKLVKGTEGQFLRQGTNEPEWAALASPLTTTKTEVHSGASPTAWTDLDLSATIGAQATLVILLVQPLGDLTMAFRTNGDSDEYYTAGDAGAGAGDCLQDKYHIFVVVSDSGGIIEWKCSATTACTIDVRAIAK